MNCALIVRNGRHNRGNLLACSRPLSLSARGLSEPNVQELSVATNIMKVLVLACDGIAESDADSVVADIEARNRRFRGNGLLVVSLLV